MNGHQRSLGRRFRLSVPCLATERLRTGRKCRFLSRRNSAAPQRRSWISKQAEKGTVESWKLLWPKRVALSWMAVVGLCRATSKQKDEQKIFSCRHRGIPDRRG